MVKPEGRRGGRTPTYFEHAPGECGRRRHASWSLACQALAVAGLLALLAGAGSRVALAEHLIAAIATKGSIHQPYGAEVLDGATEAAARINAAGGVAGQPIRIIGWSEDCTRERAVQIAEEIVRLAPAVVIGHLCAGAAMAAAPIYARAGILLIVPGVRHPELTGEGTGGLILRLAGREDRFASDTVRAIRDRYPGEGVAIVADRTRQAGGLADAIAAELSREKMALRLNERIESGEPSYDGVAARVRASGAGVVVMPAQPIELGVLIQSLRRAGVTAPLVGSEILAVPAIIATARQERDQLVLMLPWSGLDDAGSSLAVGVDPTLARREAVRRTSHAAVEIWATAARRAATVAARPVAQAARAQTAVTAVGSIRFDEAGDAIVPSYLPHVWREGAWRLLEP